MFSGRGFFPSIKSKKKSVIEPIWIPSSPGETVNGSLVRWGSTCEPDALLGVCPVQKNA